MRPASTLRDAQSLIETGWCQAADAANELGDTVNPLSPLACAWCTSGAIWRAAKGECDDYAAALVWFNAAVFTPYTAAWNDEPGRTQSQVLAAFDKAIALAEQAQ